MEESNDTPNKVTVSFKCDPSLQMRLWVQSDRAGLTMSSYVEMQLMATEQLAIRINELTDKVEEQNKQLLSKPTVLQPPPSPKPNEDKELYKRAFAQFIFDTTRGNKEKAEHFTNYLNKIIADEKSRR